MTRRQRVLRALRTESHANFEVNGVTYPFEPARLRVVTASRSAEEIFRRLMAMATPPIWCQHFLATHHAVMNTLHLILSRHSFS